MDKLISQLQNIPMEYRPIPFWSWNDELEIPELLRQIHWMHANGIGGFFMHARGGLKTPYLSEKWMDAIKACCDEAEKLGMFAWAYDENGWPSGFAGGKLLDDIQNRDQYLTYQVGTYDPNARVSYLITPEELIPVRQAQPDGEYLNVYVHISASTTDILNPNVVRQFLDVTHQQYKSHFAEDFSKKITGFFTDEPQYYTCSTPFTPMVTQYFRDHYNIDIFDQLGLLFLEKKGYETFRYRYWLAMQTLMLDSFAKQVYSWCDSNGVRLTGHYVEEASMAEQLYACAGVMPFYAYEHIPGIDWLGSKSDNELPPRQLGSVVRQMGKKQALTETFACCGWNISPADLRRIAGFQFACGTNLLCHHLLPYSEHGQRKKDYPAHFNPINPWINEHFLDFNNFFSRLGYLLSEGEEPVCVAMLHPQRSAYLTYKRGTDFLPSNELDPILKSACRKLSARGIGYHFLDETLLEEHGFVDGNQIGCGQCTYTYLVLPKMLTMSPHTEKLLRTFVENGGKVLLLDEKPCYLEGEPFDYTYLTSTCSFEEILAAQPFRMEDPNTELYAAYRILDGIPFVYLQNASREHTYTQTFRFPERIHSFEALDLITLERKHLPLTVTLQKNESLLLFPSEQEAPEIKKQETVSLRFVDAPVQFDNNFLVVDRVRYSKDGKHFSEPTLCCDLFTLLLEQRYLGKLWLQYEFEVRKIPEKLSLLAEKGAFRDCRVNGQPIFFDRTLEEEPSVAIADISSCIKIGKNTYEVALDWHQTEETFYALFGEGVTETLKNCIAYDSEIEPVYLAGKFGVYTDAPFLPFDENHLLGEEFYICDAPNTISEPVTAGLPFFRGALTLTQTLHLEKTNVRLTFPGDYLTAKVWVNDVFAGELVYRTSLDISEFAQTGENKITVQFAIGNRNLLGPLHSADPEALIWPGLFVCNDLPGAAEDHLRYKLRRFYRE